jgi:hypothetical protein
MKYDLDECDASIDHMLEDMLNSVEPPDLKSRILKRLEESQQENQEHDQAVAFAEEQIQAGYGLVIPPPIVLQDASDYQLSLWIRRGALLVATLAACLIAAIFIPKSFENAIDPDGAGQISKIDHSLEQNAGPLVEVPNPALAQNQPATTPEQKGAGELASTMGALPPSDANDETKTAGNIVPENKSAEQPRVATNSTNGDVKGNSALLNDAAIVGIVNDQLEHLWDRVGVSPNVNIQSDAWLDRATRALVGRTPTASEREAFRTRSKSDRKQEYVRKLVAGDEFARHWSGVLAQHYLGKPVVRDSKSDSQEQLFVGWIESSIAQKKSIGEMERELITFDSTGRQASNYWMEEILESSGRNQNDSFSNIVGGGKVADPRDSALIGVARQLMRISGNAAVACSQCHSPGESKRGMESVMANAKSLDTNEAFWAVAANFAGVSLERNESGRSIKVEAAKEFFFEDKEGRVKLVQSGLPSAIAQAAQGTSLGDWSRNSVEPRRAIVEMAWKNLFHQPLVPDFGLSDDEGLSEREDLRDLLASQLQLRNGDLGTLVQWIVLAKPFELERVSMDSPWYVKATESQIAIKQRELRLFASFPVTSEGPKSTNSHSLGRIATWVESSGSFGKGDATLAQGMPLKPNSGSGKPSPAKTEYSEEQVRYLISVSSPYQQLDKLTEKLAASSMTWPMLLDHAYLVAESRVPNTKEREEADKLLAAVDNDRAKAALMVINAISNSW